MLIICNKNLIECKNRLVEKFSLDSNSMELSMGMSHDFDQAVNLFRPF